VTRSPARQIRGAAGLEGTKSCSSKSG